MKKMLFAIMAAMFMMTTSAFAEVYITVVKSQQVMVVESPAGPFVWKVSTGRDGYNTPTGDFRPYLLEEMHYSSKYENSPMPHSIFFYEGYAIHATYDLKRLGRPASHGCIRLHPQDARWLFNLVQEYGKENTYIRIVD